MAKIMISLPDEFLKIIDQAAKREHRRRSEFLREAVRFFLSQKELSEVNLREDPEVRQALRVQDESRRRFRNLKVDSTEVIRRFRGRI